MTIAMEDQIYTFSTEYLFYSKEEIARRALEIIKELQADKEKFRQVGLDWIQISKEQSAKIALLEESNKKLSEQYNIALTALKEINKDHYDTVFAPVRAMNALEELEEQN